MGNLSEALKRTLDQIKGGHVDDHVQAESAQAYTNHAQIRRDFAVLKHRVFYDLTPYSGATSTQAQLARLDAEVKAGLDAIRQRLTNSFLMPGVERSTSFSLVSYLRSLAEVQVDICHVARRIQEGDETLLDSLTQLCIQLSKKSDMLVRGEKNALAAPYGETDPQAMVSSFLETRNMTLAGFDRVWCALAYMEGNEGLLRKLDEAVTLSSDMGVQEKEVSSALIKQELHWQAMRAAAGDQSTYVQHRYAQPKGVRLAELSVQLRYLDALDQHLQQAQMRAKLSPMMSLQPSTPR